MAQSFETPLARRVHPLMYLALIAACIATAGSLYFSDVFRWPPCMWCWYQRIAMYPLVPMLGIGIARRDRGILPYVLTLAGAGALAALWHIGIQLRLPFIPIEDCVMGIPCSSDNLWSLGIFPSWVTIPMLALTAFVSIIVSAVIALRAWPHPSDEPEGLPPAVFAGVIVAASIGLFVMGSIAYRQRNAATNVLTQPANSSGAFGAPASTGNGEALFAIRCAGCHASQGGGLVNIRSTWLQAQSVDSVAALITSGRAAGSADGHSGQGMPAASQLGLSDAQIRELAVYLKSRP
jgi:disulfide bond formation protein DsbB/mono/diheme cytochrome c family protein